MVCDGLNGVLKSNNPRRFELAISFLFLRERKKNIVR